MNRSPYMVIVGSGARGRRMLSAVAARRGLRPVSCSSVAEFRRRLTGQAFSLVFCKERLPDGDYRDVLGELRQAKVPVVVISGEDDWDRYLETLHRGAFECIREPSSPADIELLMDRALREPFAP
jgi:DNA-binding NtrC family response regulator